MSATIQFPYYSMYTDVGNTAIHAIVLTAKSAKLSWVQTYKALSELAKSDPDMFGEAMDTMVREMVYDAIGSSENFYL